MVTLAKRQKAKKRRKDYEKKHNIMKNNVPKSERKVLGAGDGILPESKKFQLSVKQKGRKKKAEGNIIQTATGN